MDLIPVIQLKDGHCVTLNYGRVDEPTIWHGDPVQLAAKYVSEGAQWVHVTDLDAVTHEGGNTDLISEIIRTCGGSVQIAGGFSTMDHISTAIEQGPGRVVIGSAAVTNPNYLLQAAKYHPDQIVLAMDVYQGLVTIDGWRQQTAFEPAEFIRQFKVAPLAAILITDVDQELGHSAEGSIATVAGLAADLRSPVIGGGMINNLDDIARLKYASDIDAALIGRPLFEKAMEFSQTRAAAVPPQGEPVAQFV